MAQTETRTGAAYALTGIALLVLLLANIAVAWMIQGRTWNLAVLLVIPALQAGLVAVGLMNLPKAGRVSWVYLGLALLLLIIACLALTDYSTRADPLQSGIERPGRANVAGLDP